MRRDEGLWFHDDVDADDDPDDDYFGDNGGWDDEDLDDFDDDELEGDEDKNE